MQFVFHCITADLTGTAKTGADEKEIKLDTAFHVTLKYIYSSRFESKS